MKQRILSLVLAVLMIVAAVPVLVMPAVAVGTIREGFDTSFEPMGDNWPEEGENGKPIYKGDWSIGKFVGGVYSEMNTVAENQYLNVNLDQWGHTGIFTFINSGKSALLAPGWSEEVYKTDGSRQDGPGVYDGPDDKNHAALSYTYTSPYEGKVNLSIVDIEGSLDSSGDTDPTKIEIEQAYFAIFVNDKMVWPVVDGDILDAANFVTLPQILTYDEDGIADEIQDSVESDMLQGVDVKVGDKIHFVSARVNCRYIKYTPVVEFQDGYNIAPSTLTTTFGPSSTTWPSASPMNGTGRLNQTDAYWAMGNYDSSKNAFVAYTHTTRQSAGAWAVAGTDKIDEFDNHGIMIDPTQKDVLGAYMFGDAEDASLLPALQYTAMATGSMAFSANNVNLYDENMMPAASASATIIIYVNGAKKAEVAVTTDANGVAALGAMPTGVSIVKGDTVAFVAKNGADVKLMTAEPVLTYTDIDSFISTSTSDQYALSMEKETIIVGDKIGIKFAAFATRDVYQNSDNGIVLRVWGADVEGEKTADNATDVAMTLDRTNGYAYICEYDGFSPEQMNDKITIEAYITVDGEEVCTSAKKEVSIAAIAYEQYNEAIAAEDEYTKNLMVSVLNYGAAAQKYFDYNTDNLANAGLPADMQKVEQKEDGYYRASEMDHKVPSQPNRSSSDIYAASIIIGSTVSVRVYVNVTEDEAGLPITIRYATTEDGLNDTKVSAAPKLSADNTFVLSGIGLGDLSKTLYFQVGVQIEKELVPGVPPVTVPYYGNVVSYSVESYVARMAYEADEPELAELCHALMNLSECVNAGGEVAASTTTGTAVEGAIEGELAKDVYGGVFPGMN